VKLLLDTHLLLWAVGSPDLLSASARSIIRDSRHQPVFSVVSIWEVAIKTSRGHLDFDVSPILLRETLLESGYEEMDVTGKHALAVAGLPPIHKDPFDRLLIAQAMVEEITLLTVDATVARYPGPIRKV
jgi:PIN domain nuclease of toxin-antitoxin system